MRRLGTRDILATSAVGAAVVSYLFWLSDVPLPGTSGLRAIGSVVLVLGFLASAVAVVPTFGALIHGNKVYLAITSAIGLAALAAGIVMLVSESAPALALLVVALVVLWLIATTHHARQTHLAQTTRVVSLTSRSGGIRA